MKIKNLSNYFIKSIIEQKLTGYWIPFCFEENHSNEFIENLTPEEKYKIQYFINGIKCNFTSFEEFQNKIKSLKVFL